MRRTWGSWEEEANREESDTSLSQHREEREGKEEDMVVVVVEWRGWKVGLQ